VVKYLVEEAGADERHAEGNGMTPLMWAVDEGHIEMVEYLLSRPATDVNAKTTEKDGALTFACRKGRVEMMKLLVGAGARVKAESSDELGLVAQAVVWGKLQVVKYLVEEAGADENYRDGGGWTPLMVAADAGQAAVMQYLLDRPCINIDAENERGTKAIDMACRKGHVEVVKLLVAAGARVHPQDSDATGALLQAVRGGKLDVVKYLVEGAGADVTRTGRNGITPLTLASTIMCHTDIANYLRTVVSQREHEVSVLQLA
jgi:ankyrin repeat protein